MRSDVIPELQAEKKPRTYKTSTAKEIVWVGDDGDDSCDHGLGGEKDEVRRAVKVG